METQVKQYKLGGETMYTGTIQSQVSLQMLDLKWQKKKQDINSKKDTEGMTQDEILLDSLERQAQTERERSATSELYTKLKTGGTLTEEEIAYLKEHDPEALAEYEKAQTEKKAYENALKNCRTKEDVQRLKLNRMGSFAAQAKEIASNPYIPKDKKVVLMQRLNNEVCMIRDAHQAFEKSRAYEELPEEQELRREAAEESAEKTEHQKDTEQAETTEDSKVDNKKKADADAAAEEVDEPQSDVKSEMSDVYETVEIANVESHAKIKPPELQKTAGDARMTRRQQEAAQTFTKITEEHQRYLRRSHSGRGSFTAQV